jgi:hypothetical protein
MVATVRAWVEREISSGKLVDELFFGHVLLWASVVTGTAATAAVGYLYWDGLLGGTGRRPNGLGMLTVVVALASEGYLRNVDARVESDETPRPAVIVAAAIQCLRFGLILLTVEMVARFVALLAHHA